MSTYTAVTGADRAAMLDAIGVSSVDELFERQIPAAVRLKGGLGLPAGMAEQDVYDHLRELASRNTNAEDEITFLGAGMYDHYVPSLIDMLLGRSEYLTPYTPYQPEVSQGTLQVMFEYQTAISELTGLPVSNASVYEGPSAVAAAAYLARLANGRSKLVVSRGLHPHSRQTLRTYAHGYGCEVVEVGLDGALTDPAAWSEAIDQDTCAVFAGQPNFLGGIEDVAALSAAAKERGGDQVVVCGQYDPIPLGLLRTPAECGVDVAVGEGQTLGNRLDFGGPSFAFFAATQEHIRRMPGRIAGETTDADGRRGFVLTLQTREQHIRREKATSNICTSQQLNALAGVVYLTWLGREGLVELGELLVARTAYCRDALAALGGVSALHDGPVVREFGVRLQGLDTAAVRRVIARCQEQGVNPGYALGRDYDEFSDGLLVALTEQRTREQIDRLAAVLAGALAEERA